MPFFRKLRKRYLKIVERHETQRSFVKQNWVFSFTNRLLIISSSFLILWLPLQIESTRYISIHILYILLKKILDNSPWFGIAIWGLPSDNFDCPLLPFFSIICFLLSLGNTQYHLNFWFYLLIFNSSYLYVHSWITLCGDWISLHNCINLVLDIIDCNFIYV